MHCIIFSCSREEKKWMKLIWNKIYAIRIHGNTNLIFNVVHLFRYVRVFSFSLFISVYDSYTTLKTCSVCMRFEQSILWYCYFVVAHMTFPGFRHSNTELKSELTNRIMPKEMWEIQCLRFCFFEKKIDEFLMYLFHVQPQKPSMVFALIKIPFMLIRIVFYRISFSYTWSVPFFLGRCIVSCVLNIFSFRIKFLIYDLFVASSFFSRLVCVYYLQYHCMRMTLLTFRMAIFNNLKRCFTIYYFFPIWVKEEESREKSLCHLLETSRWFKQWSSSVTTVAVEFWLNIQCSILFLGVQKKNLYKSIHVIILKYIIFWTYGHFCTNSSIYEITSNDFIPSYSFKCSVCYGKS